MAKKVLIILLNVVLVALALLLVFYLFFEKDFQQFWGLDDMNRTKEATDQKLELTIAGDYQLAKLDAFSLDPATRALTSIIYEPLVQRDFDFSLKPALALSWGEIDEKTWLFKLRSNVEFHDGSSFDADDVLLNFQIIQNEPTSDMANLLKNIDKIDKVSSQEIKVVLKENDPLFLMRISYFLQPNNAGSGTGFLALAKSEPGQVELENFTNYWGEKSFLQKTTFVDVEDAYQRVELLKQHKADLVHNIPQSALRSIDKSNFAYLTVPKLEIGFLLFNAKSKSLKGKTARMKDILDYSINRTTLLAGIDDNFSPIYQFIPRGVVGVSSEVKFPELDIYGGKKMIKDTFGENPSALVIHYLPGLNYIAESLQSDLSALGLGILIQELSWEEMQLSIKEGKADLYLLMWKFDMPDSSEFLKHFVLDNALYHDKAATDLVRGAVREEDFFRRSQKLQQVMQLIVEENPLGFPLFETNTNYVFVSNLLVRPNLDGGLNLQSIKLKTE